MNPTNQTLHSNLTIQLKNMTFISFVSLQNYNACVLSYFIFGLLKKDNV